MKKQHGLYRATKTSYAKIRHCIANELGLAEAYLIEILHGYIELNERNRNPYYFHKGYYWTSVKRDFLLERYKCLGKKRTLVKLFKTLVEGNILIVDKFNPYKSDQTNWYRINYEKLDMILADDLEPPKPEENYTHGQNEYEVRHQLDEVQDLHYHSATKGSEVQSLQNTSASNAPCNLSASDAPSIINKLNKNKLNKLTNIQYARANESQEKTFGFQVEQEAVETKVETHSLTNSAPCEAKKNEPVGNKKTLENKHSARSTFGNINEYAEMKNKRREKPQDTNRIDLATRRHLIDDIRALNDSELPIYQKAKLALLNERFCAWFNKEHQNIGNPQALLVKEWEVSMLCYLTILEREEKKKEQSSKKSFAEIVKEKKGLI